MRLCLAPWVIALTLTAVATSLPAAAAHDALRASQQRAFIQACGKSYLIHPADCGCAWKLLSERFTPARIALSISVIKAITTEQSLPPGSDVKPFCLLILEQEGANSIPFFTTLINTFKAAHQACPPSQ